MDSCVSDKRTAPLQTDHVKGIKMSKTARNKSFSKIKKELETQWLAEKMRGKVKYNLTRYRKSHDSYYGRIEIWLNNELIINSGDITSIIKHGYTYLGETEHLNAGDITTSAFYSAYYFYINHSIEESLFCDNALVRLFALLDRRLGKRKLKENKELIIQKAYWILPFYQCRYDLEYEIVQQ